MSPSPPGDTRRLRLIESIPVDRLSPRGREAKEIVTRVVEGYTHEEVAAELHLEPREVGRAMKELEVELRGLADGATIAPLSMDESSSLRDSLAALGQLVPILVDERGDVLDGTHRKAALEALGIEPVYRTIPVGADPELRRAVVLAANTVRRTISASARREAVEAEILRAPERTDRSIAAVLGVSNHAVAHARAALEERGQVLRLDRRVGKGGGSFKATKPSRPRRRSQGTAEPATVTTSPQNDPPASYRLELDTADVAGGRLGFVADNGTLRLLVSEVAWRQMGEPLAFDVQVTVVA